MSRNVTFKTGDIVQLKSGGPKMTVEQDLYDGNIHCQWFAGSKLDSGVFPKESLIKIEEDENEKRKK